MNYAERVIIDDPRVRNQLVALWVASRFRSRAVDKCPCQCQTRYDLSADGCLYIPQLVLTPTSCGCSPCRLDPTSTPIFTSSFVPHWLCIPIALKDAYPLHYLRISL